jgi:chaperonin cofactor prefoldin
MARIITGTLERVDPDQQAVLVGTVLLRVSRKELIQGLKEGMRVRVRCEHSGEQTWATAVTPVLP